MIRRIINSILIRNTITMVSLIAKVGGATIPTISTRTAAIIATIVFTIVPVQSFEAISMNNTSGIGYAANQ